MLYDSETEASDQTRSQSSPFVMAKGWNVIWPVKRIIGKVVNMWKERILGNWWNVPRNNKSQQKNAQEYLEE